MRNFFLKALAPLRWLFLLLVFVLLAVYFILYGSMPDLHGVKEITLLHQSIKIERDAQGIPTIHAADRQDTAFALGYVHAQERYFQMDLLRRSTAGELAELFGDKAFAGDIKVKVHRFRERAEQIIRKLPKQQYAVLMAYTNGVNTGMNALNNDPYQYLLIGQAPKAWEVEDSLLCIFAMYLDLNDELGERKTSLAILKQALPQQWFDFLTPEGGIWDAAMDGSEISARLKIPQQALGESWLPLAAAQQSNFLPAANFLPGSNNWAIDASMTPYDAAMLANDMHLTLRVPNIWYRASWYLQDGRRITGVTLPGVPSMVVGSNESIAWGFTNSYGNWDEVIILQTNDAQTQYLTPQGWQDFNLHSHTITSSSGHTKTHLSIETQWGPVIGKNQRGELMVHQWLAYAQQAVNLNVLQLEQSHSLKEALAVAATMGMPPQNIVIADSSGHIGWTIAGLIPERDPQTTVAQSKPWLGYLQAGDYPDYIDPSEHRIWTANNRLFADDKLSKTGFAGGDLGARAQQIRDDLRSASQFSETALLAIQLDNRSVFLQRWRQLLLDSLKLNNVSTKSADKPDAGKTAPATSVQQMTAVLHKEMTLTAQPDSVAYGLVKVFRQKVVAQSVGWIFAAVAQKYPEFFKTSAVNNMIEYPVWELVSNKPEHLIPAAYASWDEFLAAMAQQAYQQNTDNGHYPLAQQSWGRLHKSAIRHPLSAAVPGLGLFLDMPQSPLTGDDDMPKVLGRDFGASMRMVVAPGQEKNGIMQMPGGQSSHPLSSYYSLGHQDWVASKPSAFLPGKTQWLLEFRALQ